MKNILIVSSMALLLSSATCKSQKTGQCFKGRLEIKALCLNYTIKLLEGNVDTSLINGTWTDAHSGKTYNGVFGLANPCSFPDKIKEGGEFYFVIDSSAKNDCAACEAYYPTPEKKLPIKVMSACH